MVKWKMMRMTVVSMRFVIMRWGKVEGMECQDISERMSNPLASLWLASNNETSLVPDVQNEDPISQIVISVTDHDCDQ